MASPEKLTFEFLNVVNFSRSVNLFGPKWHSLRSLPFHYNILFWGCVHLSPASVHLSPAKEGGLVELLWTCIAVRNTLVKVVVYVLGE